MATMDLCNVCCGHGFINYYHQIGHDLEEDRDTRPCPSCHGVGYLESWRQVATGMHRQRDWTGSGPPYREEGQAIQAKIRQREEPR